MSRLAAAVLALAILAGCGPDCDRYCGKIGECEGAQFTELDRRRCESACEEIGEDQARTIDCVIEHTCSDIRAGHCDPTGQAGLAP